MYQNFKFYSVIVLTLLLFSFADSDAFARHHHEEKQVYSQASPNSPQQSPEDISPFARKAAQNAKARANTINSKDLKNNQAIGPAILPDHYTKRSKKLNGKDGWVGSSNRIGKNDIGLNAPVPVTADPTSNKTRGIFRRGMRQMTPDY